MNALHRPFGVPQRFKASLPFTDAWSARLPPRLVMCQPHTDMPGTLEVQDFCSARIFTAESGERIWRVIDRTLGVQDSGSAGRFAFDGRVECKTPTAPDDATTRSSDHGTAGGGARIENGRPSLSDAWSAGLQPRLVTWQRAQRPQNGRGESKTLSNNARYLSNYSLA